MLKSREAPHPFDEAVKFVLANEGGLCEHPNDRGGITKYGISAAFLRSFGDRYDRNRNGIVDDDIRALTQADAVEIYREHFWLEAYERIQTTYIRNYIFDMAVSMSPAIAHKLLQRATWACAARKDYVIDDGILGAKTIAAVNRCIFLLPALMAERAGYYRARASERQSQMVFLDGWLNRTYRKG